MHSGDMEKLNPQIRDAEIGTRSLRKIKIYPMSMADQTRFITLLEEVLNSYFKHKGKTDEIDEDNLVSFIMSLTDVLGKNVKDMIKMVLDSDEIKPDGFFENVTNTQMSEILTFVIEDNFEEPAKNVLSLFKKYKELFLLERQSPTSLKDMPNTTSDISSENHSEKGD